MEFESSFRQCLDWRIVSSQQLEEDALIWQADRNAAASKVNWSCTTEKTRDKLKNRDTELTKAATQN